MCGRGKNHPITCRSGSISISRRNSLRPVPQANQKFTITAHPAAAFSTAGTRMRWLFSKGSERLEPPHQAAFPEPVQSKAAPPVGEAGQSAQFAGFRETINLLESD